LGRVRPRSARRRARRTLWTRAAGLHTLDRPQPAVPRPHHPAPPKAALAGRAAPYTDTELTELARRCTQQEDSAAKVERQVRKSAAALLLEARIGERFDAIVTGSSAKGT